MKRDGFVIYPGQQSLEGTIFRIAVMGDLEAADMERFVDCFAAAITAFAGISK